MLKQQGIAMVLVMLATASVGPRVAAAELLDNEDLIQMLKAGISLVVIVKKVEQDSTPIFISDSNELIKIKKAAEEGAMGKAEVDRLLELVITTANKSKTNLRGMVTRLVNLCENFVEAEYESLMRELLRQGKTVVPYLLEQIEAESERKRAGVIDALGRVGDKSEPVLLSIELMLYDRNPGVRAKAAEALAKLANEKLSEKLLGDIKTKQGEKVDGIFLFFGHLKDAKALPTITEALKNLTDEDSRVAAAFALGEMRAKDAHAVDALLRGVLDEQSVELRYHCARALGLIGHGAAFTHIKRAFERFPKGKARILTTLSNFKYIEVIEFLVGHTTADDPEVRKAALHVLEILTGERYSASEDWETWVFHNKARPDWSRLETGPAAEPAKKTQE